MTTRNVKILEPSTALKKPHYMTSLYLDPINVEPNVSTSEECPAIPNIMGDVEASETNNRPRDDVDKNIRVRISQLLGIKPKTGVVPNVSTSLAQPDYTTKIPLSKTDVNVSTLSLEKSKDKEEYDGILTLGIAKRLKNKKGQSIESSSRPSKSLRKRASVGPTKRWIKVVTLVSKNKFLKRKEVPSESSGSYHDIKHNVQDIVSTTRKQESEKKIPVNIPEVAIGNISFHSVENVEKWYFFYQRRLTLEREMGKYAFECKKVMSLIQEVGLMKTVTGFGKCYGMLVKEFIVNIYKEYDNKRSKKFRKVEITAKQVKEWPRKGKLSASALSGKYDVLHMIGTTNWVPTNHTSNIAMKLGKFIYIVGTKSSFDFGSYVFDQTMKHVASYDVKMPIAFPSTICGVILSQHPSILISSDSVCKRDPPLSLHYRLFTGKHVSDIVMTSGHYSSRPTPRTSILAKLKDTCKTLDETIKSCIERKSKLESLIKALSKEEGILKDDGIGEEDANEEGSDASDDEHITEVESAL
ncbi:uncharacterized protein LOC127094553 [Lathyrus oleraceus]|uniref:uncharacterized protein LOC127094553 n=1 Tax=Pisum sativum TaxID=3888 RepID=UPI0021CFE0A8|nr:uncharacterized protein LOC127094553 [Pisum sativum]